MRPVHSSTSDVTELSTAVSFGVPKRAPSMLCASLKMLTSTWRLRSVRSYEKVPVDELTSPCVAACTKSRSACRMPVELVLCDMESATEGKLSRLAVSMSELYAATDSTS